MCGIACLWSPNPLPAKLVADMIGIVPHRGPDDEGYALVTDDTSAIICCSGESTPEQVINSRFGYSPSTRIEDVRLPFFLALGHCRLSIVDLSPYGHQPMCSQDQRFWIVYNGEIYNYRLLRAELEHLGHVFVSSSDTEIILAAYAEWGDGCLDRFNGMWSFALYDTLEKKLFLSRDRFGVKPLYYWCSPAGFLAFGSEIKQFTVLPGWKARINGKRSYDFLVWGLQDHTAETMFEGVYQLPPGHFVELVLSPQSVPGHCIPSGQLPTRQWYTLPAHKVFPVFEAASMELRNLLIDSVKLRSRADVPIGSCLSGGLDSSSIVCILNRLLVVQNAAGLQKTFSACSDVERFDERNWIECVTKFTEVDSHCTTPAFDRLFEHISSITWHQDEPFGTTSVYAQWNVFSLAEANGVKVILDGQGADELLAGYHSFFPSYLSGLLCECKFKQLYNEMQDLNRIHHYSLVQLLRFIFGVTLPSVLQPPIKHIMGISDPHSSDWLSRKHLGISEDYICDALEEGVRSVDRLSRIQFSQSNLPKLLHWEDRNSMAHGIESRLPFLDYRIVEYVMTLPDEYKISEGTTKRLLRSAMTDILPIAVRDRVDKIGFATAEESWLKENQQEFRSKLKQSIDASCGVLRPSAMDLFDDIVSGRRPFSFQIWRMISFGEWMSCFSIRS